MVRITLYITGETVTITATVDKKVTAGSTFTAQLDVTGTGAASSAMDPTLTFTAAADGLTLTADHTVAAGERIDAVKIVSSSFTVGTTTLDSQYTGSGLQSTFPTNENIKTAVLFDGVSPTARPTAVAYNPTANKITITSGTSNFDFSGIASSTTDDIKAYLDWTKFKWILDEQDSGGTATFNGSGVTTPDSNYVTSALDTGDTTMEITLATAGAALLEGNAKFGNLGGTGAFERGTDAVRIEEGFIKDKSGNPANVDGSTDSNNNATIDTTNDYVLFSNVNNFSAESTSKVAVAYDSSETAPTVQSFTLAAKSGTDGSDNTYITGETVTITATVDKKVTAGSTFTAQLDVTGTGAASSATDPTLTFTAAADGLTLTADHTVAAGERIDAVKIVSSSFTVGTTTLDSQYTGSGLQSTFPTNENIKTAVLFDGVSSNVTVNSIDYNPATNNLILKGTNFDPINASSTTADIKAYLGQNSKKILLGC